MTDPVGVEAAGRRHPGGVAAFEVEPTLVQRAADDAPVQLTDRERSAHVRAAVVGDVDAVGCVREQEVETVEGHPGHPARGDLLDGARATEGGVVRPWGLESCGERGDPAGHPATSYPGTRNAPGGVATGGVERARSGGAGYSVTEVAGLPPAEDVVEALAPAAGWADGALLPAATVSVGTGASLVARSGISLMATAATAATIAPTTPSQNVWAVARLKAPWRPWMMLAMNGSTAGRNASGMPARMAAPRSKP